MTYFRSDETSEPTYSHNGQTMYLVFESALIMLFSTCVYCTSPATIKKVVIGTFLQITQTCTQCSKIRVWESQPYIGRVPAGNILTSAAILYSGTLPSKALHMFQFLNLATITKRTFFRHQDMYLQPAVMSVWTRSQQLLLQSLINSDSQLAVAGDGRSDSPGHSAKYGSYSILELKLNKIIDFKLVQVNLFSIRSRFVLLLQIARYYRVFLVYNYVLEQ